MSRTRALPLLVLASIPLIARVRVATADDACLDCRAVNIAFTVDEFSPPASTTYNPPPQIVIWLETAAGEYVETSTDGAPLFITQQTGKFGLGNRPGRMDFNSGPLWPYGRREAIFPVWSHRYSAKWGQFPRVVFQSGTEDDLSHSVITSSVEQHYCRPQKNVGSDKPAWDAGTCATGQSNTDKGVFSSSMMSNYPPRADLVRRGEDSISVDMYGVVNQFDAVSQATPRPGTPQILTWALPSEFPSGDYVLWVEVGKEFDYNAMYNETSFPSPAVQYGDYGLPYRGQPSVLYKVPFKIEPGQSMMATDAFAGYGDPDGLDGNVRPPDATITTDVPGSGASRLKLEADARGTYRVRVEAQNEHDCILPAPPADMAYLSTEGRVSTFEFVSPGDDAMMGKPSGYEIRYRVGADITEADFATANKLETPVTPVDGGSTVMVKVDTLLPETDYVVAVRAYDNCHNLGPISTLRFTTPGRETGEVDACFIATAAYGSVMANDVSLLRHFRDAVIRNTVIGELAVESYYTFGPAIAGVVGESDLLRATARSALAPVIDWVKQY